tara:strand:- start:1143 stop:1379 length:237 start_codon:yes stop_codon:yes gene_type:complete
MDSVNTDERVESFLSIMLEGYEANLTGVTQYIDQTETQLNTAKDQKVEILNKIADLKEMLGLGDEEESSNLELVKDSE